MSRTAVIRAVAACTAVVCMTSCRTAGSRSRDPNPKPTSPIKINFSCDGNITIGLVGANGDAGWVIKVTGGDPISWEVPANVTIDTIVSKKTTEPLPIEKESPNAPQGGSKGTPWKSRAKGGGDKSYDYAIRLRCTPTAGGNDVPLIIDPVMIVH